MVRVVLSIRQKLKVLEMLDGEIKRHVQLLHAHKSKSGCGPRQWGVVFTYPNIHFPTFKATAVQIIEGLLYLFIL